MSDPQPAVDYSRWPGRRRLSDLDAAPAALAAADGVVSVDGDHPPLDILVSGVAAMVASGTPGTILVGLSGAVAERAGKLGPFFSGVGIARETGLPLIALSDPTLAMNADVPLAWYAGNHAMPDLPARLARLLSAVAESTGSRLLLFGGSGGGFAALQLAPMIGASATALVWNPQTAIADYVPAFVAQYLAVAFPASARAATAAAALPTARAHASLRELLEEHGVAHDVRGLAGRDNSLLYMQNVEDWHLAKHAVPYMRNMRLRRSDGAVLVSETARQAIWLGHWGDGHAPPPKEMIVDAIHALVRGDTPSAAAEELQRRHGDERRDAPASHSFHYGARVHQLTVSADVTAEGVLATARLAATADTDALPAVGYAFYLLRDGKRHDARWYEAEPTATFSRPTEPGRWQLQAFAKDRFGDVLISEPLDIP